MSRVYAIEEGTGRRFLSHLECDECDATIKPHPTISESGWVYAGYDHGPGTEAFTYDFCPAHAHIQPGVPR